MRIEYSEDYRRMLQGRRVLVVEDEALIGMLLEDELLKAGAEVVGPACSVKALRRPMPAFSALTPPLALRRRTTVASWSQDIVVSC